MIALVLAGLVAVVALVLGRRRRGANTRPANEPITGPLMPQVIPAGEDRVHTADACRCEPVLGLRVTAAGDPVAVLLHSPLGSRR